MIRVDSDPPDLTRDPQLALVLLLKAVLQIAEYTLIDLTSPSFIHDNDGDVHSPTSEEDACVTALFLQIHALDDVLDLYRFAVRDRLRASYRRGLFRGPSRLSR